MEEGHLGKPYNLSLLKRLIPYARVYKKTVFLALFLTVLITLIDLSIPYIPKIAIDRYILNFWYMINYTAASKSLTDDFNEKYKHLVFATKKASLALISNARLRQIDQRNLKEYREGMLITKKKYYKLPYELEQVNALFQEKAIQGYDGSLFIPSRELEGLPGDKLLKLRKKDFKGVLAIGVILFLLVGGSFFLNYFEYYFLERSGQNMMHDIRMDLFDRIQGFPIQFFDENPVGRLVTRATNDVENLSEMFKSVLITVFKDIFLLSGIIAALLYLNWRLALISFVLLPFVFWLTLFFSRQAREIFREIRKHIAAMNAFLQERLTGIRIIQLFAQEKSQLGLFKEINQKNYLASIKQIKIFAVFMPSMEVFSFLGIGILIWYGGGRVLENQLTLGALVAFIGYIQMFFKPIRDLSEKYNIMQSAMASMERIFELMDQKNDIYFSNRPKQPLESKGHLEFKNIYFSYKKGLPVLKDMSFEVMPGQMVALVGVTGSGKTTTINLIERFYEPERGSVLLDEIDIREYDVNDLRSRIAIVMQDVFIFAGNIADNISLGNTKISDKTLIDMSKKANAYRFINNLPDGFNHKVNEAGMTISAGERQLLALSRALAYKPRLLILDEATSSVDPETERLIQESIFNLSKNQTTLIIAHRPSTMQQADRILVLNHGRIIEQGTHEELMSAGNIYFTLNQLHKKE